MQLWTASIADAHDACCGCTKALTHLLSLLIPENHKYRNYTVQQIIEEETKDSQCLFGGKDERGGTTEAEEDHGIKEEQNTERREEITDEDLEALLAAAAEDDVR